MREDERPQGRRSTVLPSLAQLSRNSHSNPLSPGLLYLEVSSGDNYQDTVLNVASQALASAQSHLIRFANIAEGSQ